MSSRRARQPEDGKGGQKPVVRMCVSGKPLISKTADIGDRVVLFVDFGPDFKPLRTNTDGREVGPIPEAVAENAEIQYSADDQYMIKFVGLPVPLQMINPCDQCRNFRCEIRLIATEVVQPAKALTCEIPYCNNQDEYVDRVTEADIQEEHKVYHYPLWEDLLEHNETLKTEIQHQTSTGQLGALYGSVRRRQPLNRDAGSSFEETWDGVDGRPDVELGERQPLLQAPVERYWPDTWEMKCWGHCCRPCLRPTNCFTKFWAYFFVTPLTNVAISSLYYQLYLSEIFHSRFWTRLGHYACMPLIVLTMLTFFAQWRFGDNSSCYETDNFEILIMNGNAILALILLLWYTVWGIVQKTPLMGFFMILPLFVLYALANIYFQVAVKNSLKPHGYNCTSCWNHTNHLSNHIQYYSSIELIYWYYNPIIWAFVMSFFQAMSHMFEPKLPPRVTGTDHWMSCMDILKFHGFTNFMLICVTQAIFGTVDEFLASARLFPLLNLRVCYSLGYSARQWKTIQKLVKMSMAYGNPAIDFIGTGGTDLCPTSPRIKNKYISDLKRELHEMDQVLTDEHKVTMSDPRKLQNEHDGFVKQYIFLQHYIAKYELQVHAYGPFRTNNDGHMAERDDERMKRDFPQDESFRKFLQQVRFTLWMMEDKYIERETERRRLAQ